MSHVFGKGYILYVDRSMDYAALLYALQGEAEGQSELLRAMLPEDLFQLLLLQNGGTDHHPRQIDLNDPSQINPDVMSYEQLLELEEKMGKVIKGLTAKQIRVIVRRIKTT